MSIFKTLEGHARSRLLYLRLTHGAFAAFAAPKHTLPSELIVSFTSFGARLSTLPATIRCLLTQSLSPDFVILWVSPADFANLPQAVRRLRSSRFLIEQTEDIRSYTKIIPCIRHAPKAFILTCDDDVYYPPNWLRTVVERYRPGTRITHCNRAHKLRVDDAGIPLPYLDWELETSSGEASNLIFPTGVGGVLYEPGVFHPDVTDAKKFQALCPTADDIWLYWMTALNGFRSATTGLLNGPVSWPASQRQTLRGANMPRGGGNDLQVGRMLETYGSPLGTI